MELTIIEIQQYLDACKNQKNLDSKTIKAYKIDLRQFSEYLSNENIEFDREAIKGYLALLNQKFKPRTVKRKWASIRAFTTWLMNEGMLDKNPFETLQLETRASSQLPRVIPSRIVERMLRAAHGEATFYPESERALCEVAVLELLFATGIRVSELCGITARDLDLEDGVLRIMGKGRRERIIYVEHEGVLSILHQYKKQRAPEGDEPFFRNQQGRALSADSVRAIVRKYGQLSGWGERITPHMFRHTLATELLENGVNIRYIQQLLGHSLITTTQIYTHVAGSKQREIMRYQHPRNKMLLPAQHGSAMSCEPSQNV